MTLTPVVSAALSHHGYSPVTQIMHVRFKSGPTVYSAKVSPALFAKYEAAESKGKFWHAHLKKLEWSPVE